jgi:hypothetical protein
MKLNQWVNVSEELPEQIGMIVDLWVQSIPNKREYRITNAKYEGEGYFIYDGITYYCEPLREVNNNNTFVTHWMLVAVPCQISCNTCKYEKISKYLTPCFYCTRFSEHQPK